MNEVERNEVNHLTALRGEQLGKIGGHDARHLTLETISVLDMCGSPVAVPIRAALNGTADAGAVRELRAYDLALLAWAFCAPEDEVLEVALDCTPAYSDPAIKAALKFTRGWQLADFRGVVPHVEAEMKALRAAFFEAAAPDYGGDSSKKKDTANAGCH